MPDARGRFDDEPVVRVEHDLIARLEHGIADRLAVDDAAIGGTQVAQDDDVAAQVDAGVALGERRVVDADVGLRGAADQSRAFEGEAASVMAAPDPAQHDAQIRSGVHGFVAELRWNRRHGTARYEDDFSAFDIDRIAEPKHRHVPYRPTVDVNATRGVIDGHPDAATVHAELQEGLPERIDDADRAVVGAADAMHAGTQRRVGDIGAGESQSDLIHGRQSSRSLTTRRGLDVTPPPPHNARPVALARNPCMSTIEIRHPHTLPPQQARQAVEDFAVKLGQRFGLDYRWEGDVLHFKRSGVDGRIALLPGELHVSAKLGLLFAAMKGSIEQEMRRVLAERLG